MELTSTNRSRAYPTDFEYGAQAKIHKSHRKHMLLLDSNFGDSQLSYPVLKVQPSILFACSEQCERLYRSLIAQLVEHSTVNRVVTGSSPVRGAIALIAQSVECIHGKDEVTGSIPVESSIYNMVGQDVQMNMARWSRG